MRMRGGRGGGRGTRLGCSRQLVEKGVKLPCVAVHEGAEAGQGSGDSGGRLRAGQVHGGLAELGGQGVACQVVTGSWAWCWCPILGLDTGHLWRRKRPKSGEAGESAREA